MTPPELHELTPLMPQLGQEENKKKSQYLTAGTYLRYPK